MISNRKAHIARMSHKSLSKTFQVDLNPFPMATNSATLMIIVRDSNRKLHQIAWFGALRHQTTSLEHTRHWYKIMAGCCMNLPGIWKMLSVLNITAWVLMQSRSHPKFLEKNSEFLPKQFWAFFSGGCPNRNAGIHRERLGLSAGYQNTYVCWSRKIKSRHQLRRKNPLSWQCQRVTQETSESAMQHLQCIFRMLVLTAKPYTGSFFWGSPSAL